MVICCISTVIKIRQSESENNDPTDSECNNEFVAMFGSDTEDENQMQVVVTIGGRKAGSWKNAFTRFWRLVMIY